MTKNKMSHEEIQTAIKMVIDRGSWKHSWHMSNDYGTINLWDTNILDKIEGITKEEIRRCIIMLQNSQLVLDIVDEYRKDIWEDAHCKHDLLYEKCEECKDL